MVNGFRCERWKASALSTALTIYPCQIRVHQRWQSKLQLPTARKKEWRPVTAGSSPHAVTCQHCDTHYFSRPRTRNLPIVGWLLVRRATSSATDSPNVVFFFCENDVIVIWCTSTSIFMDYENFTHPTGDIRPLAPLCLCPCRADSRFTLIVAVSDLLLTE